MISMSSQVELDFQDETDGKRGAICHFMPCKIITEEEEAKVKGYFEPCIKILEKGGDQDQGRKGKNQEQNGVSDEQEQPILTASFQGRPLQGRCIMLPEGFKGHVINKSQKKTIQNPAAARTRVVKKHFDSFTYWNWDQIPEQTDTVVRGLSWIKVAKSIHDPI